MATMQGFSELPKYWNISSRVCSGCVGSPGAMLNEGLPAKSNDITGRSDLTVCKNVFNTVSPLDDSCLIMAFPNCCTISSIVLVAKMSMRKHSYWLAISFWPNRCSTSPVLPIRRGEISVTLMPLATYSLSISVSLSLSQKYLSPAYPLITKGFLSMSLR